MDTLIPWKRRCRLESAPHGLFYYGGTLALKTEYGCDSYIVSTGEAFWGPKPQTTESRNALLVYPVYVVA